MPKHAPLSRTAFANMLKTIAAGSRKLTLHSNGQQRSTVMSGLVRAECFGELFEVDARVVVVKLVSVDVAVAVDRHRRGRVGRGAATVHGHRPAGRQRRHVDREERSFGVDVVRSRRRVSDLALPN